MLLANVNSVFFSPDRRQPPQQCRQCVSMCMIEDVDFVLFFICWIISRVEIHFDIAFWYSHFSRHFLCSTLLKSNMSQTSRPYNTQFQHVHTLKLSQRPHLPTLIPHLQSISVPRILWHQTSLHHIIRAPQTAVHCLLDPPFYGHTVYSTRKLSSFVL